MDVKYCQVESFGLVPIQTGKVCTTVRELPDGPWQQAIALRVRIAPFAGDCPLGSVQSVQQPLRLRPGGQAGQVLRQG